jgi:hypothetical protein
MIDTVRMSASGECFETPSRAESPCDQDHLKKTSSIPAAELSAESCFRDAGQWPNSTACMMRPGTKVNRPAMTSAPVKIAIMALR